MTWRLVFEKLQVKIFRKIYCITRSIEHDNPIRMFLNHSGSPEILLFIY